MTPKPEIFRYATEREGEAPTFADSRTFEFDRYANGEPTAYKLAKVAAPIEYGRDDKVLDGWPWHGGQWRFFFWNRSGEFYGSIEVALAYEPRFEPLAKTVKRAAEDAA